ncbi:50S ribosomal protein L4 [Spiroplasma platyhelix]|uniref:Large ribosomal subunit protein uL4 n=1 Tax=Spiroplasma platyhelix PALS-1 TaxID=1276218 RepID=A0A846TX63_9MOLU|nr:50S ribosomal protein L4 [Spiroplasma platyhelix]MBE4704279.1 50S ribosomal protein L4 [Spiroplasma platyhelix PALS-1]NKE38651.1 50S ribosomal protein L4 [Spiroplasma platyhelix PALS-1]UJB28863.1 50S ribosomal protein L4 [Spiroplasma platyhelix PALS-1]
MKINVVDSTGKKVSEFTLNEKVWAVTPNQQAQFDSLLSYNATKRQGTHKVKTRAEVSGGGRKPWKQKGTGNARQGSIRAPQWKGGGIVFGPTPEKNYLIKLNKKVRKLALKSALAAKLQNENIIVIDQLKFEKPSTKSMLEVLTNLELANNKTLIISDVENHQTVIKSARNLTRTQSINAKSVNIYDLLNANKVLVTLEAIKNIEEALG